MLSLDAEAMLTDLVSQDSASTGSLLARIQSITDITLECNGHCGGAFSIATECEQARLGMQASVSAVMRAGAVEAR